jgi:hypothetical protein
MQESYSVEAMGIGGWKVFKVEKYLGPAMDYALSANLMHGERSRVVRRSDDKVIVEYGGPQ